MKPSIFEFRLLTSAAVIALLAASLTYLQGASVVVWGPGSFGQTNVPAGLSNAVAMDGGAEQSQALRSDGNVVAWGSYDNNDGRGSQPMFVPEGLSNVVAIACGGWFNVALRSHGTVVTIAAGDLHSMALRSNGTVVGWGYSDRTNVPPGLSNVVAIAGGMTHTLAIVGPVSPLALTTMWPSTTTLFFRQTGLMEQRSFAVIPDAGTGTEPRLGPAFHPFRLRDRPGN
jgi:alpha-tubulin suppressor-like RCC1 family protein